MTIEIDPGLFRGCPRLDTEEGKADHADHSSCCKLHVTDWLKDIPNPSIPEDLVEIRFKNTQGSQFSSIYNQTR